MPYFSGRLDFLQKNPRAAACAALDEATRRNTASVDKSQIDFSVFDNKDVIIIGSGVGGLTTAYELVKNNSTVNVTVLEARDRTGGRCLSLRSGDTLVECKKSDIYDPNPETTSQTVQFDKGEDDYKDGYEPYLNAGPGRIPSSHILLLGYLQELRVPIEVYIMNSESNLVQTDCGIQSGGQTQDPVMYRRLIHNTRGRIAEGVYKNAQQILESVGSMEPSPEYVQLLKSLMVTFGELNQDGEYRVEATEPGTDEGGATRAGFTEVPGIQPGRIAPSFTLGELLDSAFWDKTGAYQPRDFLWQQTLFHPVHGMDQVQKALADAVQAKKNGRIVKNCPVKRIDYDGTTAKYCITTNDSTCSADYVFCNAAIPFLENMLTENLLPPFARQEAGGFSPEFCRALRAVFETQKCTSEKDRFLANTTKVGWQGDRSFWQQPIKTTTKGRKSPGVGVGVMPIFGGISWTDDPITQIWYPSNRYHDKKGILTGCYNFDDDAIAFGKLSPEERIEAARTGAKKFGVEFGDNLEHGVAIAWQNIQYINGGWPQWHAVGDESVEHYCSIVNGTDVDGSGKRTFFIVGDQASSLPGWQEGAAASALQALLCASINYKVPKYRSLPDTRLMVQGV